MHLIYTHLVQQVGILADICFGCLEHRLYHLKVWEKVQQVSSSNHLPERLPVNRVGNVQGFQASDVNVEALLDIFKYLEKDYVCDMRVPSAVHVVSRHLVSLCEDDMFKWCKKPALELLEGYTVNPCDKTCSHGHIQAI